MRVNATKMQQGQTGWRVNLLANLKRQKSVVALGLWRERKLCAKSERVVGASHQVAGRRGLS